MSRSMSGGPSRPADRNRSNSNSCFTESTLVIPSAKQTAEFAAEPRPWHRMPASSQNLTMSWTIRK